MKTINQMPVGILVCLLAFGLQANDQTAVATMRDARAIQKQSHFDRHAEELKFQRLHLQNENGEIPENAWMTAAAQRQKIVSAISWGQKSKTDLYQPKTAGIQRSGWTWQGPGNVGGRVRSIVVHPTIPGIMWAGSVGGGVWKTLNGGDSWFPLDDFMANLAVSCMVMDPTNANVLYAGTGESLAGTGGSFALGGDGIQGAGIFKTTDGGTTWAQLPSTATGDFLFVNRLAINPNNSQIILAATLTGIFRTTDGGATWTRSVPARGGLDITDIGFDPHNGSKCIASGFGFVRFSTDGGVSWTIASGLPSSGRIEFAYFQLDPDFVYANADHNFGEVYRSTDGGHTFVLQNTGTQYFRESGTTLDQGNYDNCIWCDPINPNIILVGGLDLWRSIDGGVTLTDIGGYSGSIHPDQHVIVGNPIADGTHTAFIGNDGGIFKTTDYYGVSSSGGWANLNRNLGITQFYGGAGNASSGHIVGGAQDNGTVRSSFGGTQSWTQMIDGDGGFCAADPIDQHYLYGEYVFLTIERQVDGDPFDSGPINSGITDAGTAANFIAPFILDPNNPNTMLAGGLRLWRSTNVKAGLPSSPTWSNIKAGLADTNDCISAIAVAPGNSDVIWVGHNFGEVFATANGTAVNPTWTRKDLGSPALPQRFCTRIAINPTNSSKVYVTFGGFSSGNVWRTTNGGATWTDISGNLPQAPVNSIVINPHITKLLYVGTEVGVFASDDDGAHWSASNDGPANVAVDELFWVDDTLCAATHGRGLFSAQPIIWVQFGLADSGIGSFAKPFNTMAAGVTAVVPGGLVVLKGVVSSPEKLTISKPMTIWDFAGPTTVGH
jgi:photosystem II stability/assembly factor-like uncharacterized protein